MTEFALHSFYLPNKFIHCFRNLLFFYLFELFDVLGVQVQTLLAKKFLFSGAEEGQRLEGVIITYELRAIKVNRPQGTERRRMMVEAESTPLVLWKCQGSNAATVGVCIEVLVERHHMVPVSRQCALPSHFFPKR